VRLLNFFANREYKPDLTRVNQARMFTTQRPE